MTALSGKPIYFSHFFVMESYRVQISTEKFFSTEKNTEKLVFNTEH